jgi:hypothetical protein
MVWPGVEMVWKVGHNSTQLGWPCTSICHPNEHMHNERSAQQLLLQQVKLLPNTNPILHCMDSLCISMPAAYAHLVLSPDQNFALPWQYRKVVNPHA